MLKELKESMDNQIISIRNYYNILDTVVFTTDTYFKVTHNFKHPVAAVAWTWKNFDIWITENVLSEDTECIFSIVVFDNTDSENKVYCNMDILDIDNKFSTRINTECSSEDLNNYFSLISNIVNSYKGVTESELHN